MYSQSKDADAAAGKKSGGICGGSTSDVYDPQKEPLQINTPSDTQKINSQVDLNPGSNNNNNNNNNNNDNNNNNINTTTTSVNTTTTTNNNNIRSDAIKNNQLSPSLSVPIPVINNSDQDKKLKTTPRGTNHQLKIPKSKKFFF